LPGYDAREYFDWLEKYNSIPKGVNSGGNGNRLLFKERIIDLTQTFNPGESIFIRFRLYTNSVGYGWGWAIDNLQIQEEVVGFEEFLSSIEHFNIFPNPSDGEVQIELNGLPPNEFIKIEIINTRGKSVYYQSFDHFINQSLNHTADLSHLKKGLYLVNVFTGDRHLSRKLLLR